MSLQVHYMALESERRLLPTQAERGWRIEQAAATSAPQALMIRRRAGGVLRTVLDRCGQSLQAIAASTRPANAPLA